MAIKCNRLTLILLFSLIAWIPSPSVHAQTLVNSFNAGISGLNGIGFNDATETIYAHASGSNTIQLYNLAGTNTGSIPDPGDAGNDSDYFFTSVATIVAGTAVAANSLMVIEDDVGVAQLIAADPTSGEVLATQDLEFVAGQLVGGAYNPATGTFFAVDWSQDVIYEFDGSDGTLLNTFSVGENFDIFYGDLAVNEADGNLYVVSSSQTFLRVLDTSGIFVRDVELSGIGVSGMSGIAFRESTGEVLISSTNGLIYQVDGLPASIRADSFEVTRGNYVAGDISNLIGSDNGDLQARRGSTDIQSRVEVEIKGTSTTEAPATLTFRHEGSVFARTDVTQILEMYDYDVGSWEQVDSRLANRFTDLSTEAVAAGDLSRFVEAGTSCMRARVRFVSTNPRQQFQANIDQMIWSVE